jgi:hypothetical protein
LLPDEKNRMKAKDIFTHPWVKGFEEQLKMKKVNRSPERGMRSPERTVKDPKIQRSPDRNATNKTDNKIQRSPDRNLKTSKERSPERIREINLPLKREVIKEKSPSRNLSKNSELDLAALKKKSDNLIIKKEIKMNNEVKRENSAGPIDLNQMKQNLLKKQSKVLESESTEFNLLDQSNEERAKEKDIFNKVMDRVYLKNTGKNNKNSRNKADVDIDSIIQQDSINYNPNRSIDYSESFKFHLLTDRNELEKQLQIEANKIRKNKNKLNEFKNENDRLETYQGNLKSSADFDDEFQGSSTHRMQSDYYPKKKNFDLDRSFGRPEKLSTMPHSISTEGNNLNEELYIGLKSRASKRGSNIGRKSNYAMRQQFVTEVTRE